MRIRPRFGSTACILIGVAALGLGFAACNISIDLGDNGSGGGTSGGDGLSISFTVAGKTITLSLGVAGVFDMTPGVTATSVADVQPFAQKPADDVGSATMWLPQTHVQVCPRIAAKSTVAQQSNMSGTVLLRVSIDRPGASDPCATGTDIGTYEIEVENGRIVSVSRALEIRFDSLQRFLDNDMSMCMEVDAPFESELIVDLFELQFQPLASAGTRECGTLATLQTTPEVCCLPLFSGYQFDIGPELTPLSEFEARLNGSCAAIGETPFDSRPPWANRDECVCSGGVPKGQGTTCETVVCNEPFQACCVPVFLPGCIEVGLNDCVDNIWCSERLAEDCVALGGVPGGEGVHCHDFPCEVPDDLEACCKDGRCTNQNPTTCANEGGRASGPGTTCFVDFCAPVGACCSSGDECDIEEETACGNMGRTYRGDGTTCSPNPCAQATGACCASDGDCSTETASACQDVRRNLSGERHVLRCHDVPATHRRVL